MFAGSIQAPAYTPFLLRHHGFLDSFYGPVDTVPKRRNRGESYVDRELKNHEKIVLAAAMLAYVYADNGLKHVAGFANADTTELYAQLGYGPATLKYSHAVTNQLTRRRPTANSWAGTRCS